MMLFQAIIVSRHRRRVNCKRNPWRRGQVNLFLLNFYWDLSVNDKDPQVCQANGTVSCFPRSDSDLCDDKKNLVHAQNSLWL